MPGKSCARHQADRGQTLGRTNRKYTTWSRLTSQAVSRMCLTSVYLISHM